MALSLPSFAELRANYPVMNHDALMSSIGGGVSGSYILNGCVVRMSKAFNYLGASADAYKQAPIPSWKQNTGVVDFATETKKMIDRANTHRIPEKHNFIEKFTTTYGLDKKRYCYRVNEFFNYLNHKYKKPDLKVERVHLQQMISQENINKFIKSITDQTGIICFKTKFGNDAPGTAASGHFTLWDGRRCLYHDYFLDPRTSAIYLWKC